MEQDFITLIENNTGIIHKVCYMFCSDDAARQDLYQDIVANAWQAFARFRGDSKPSTWLYKVALNTAVTNNRRASKNIRAEPMPVNLNIPNESNGYEEQQFHIMQELIKQLPQLDKAIIVLYLEDKSYAEIAEIIGIGVSNVGTRIGRIKERLKQMAKHQ